MSGGEILQSDQADGAPHPKDTANLIGQQQAENNFLAAFNSGRLHHAWMLTGPRGVGKATLAWKIARFLLCQTDTGNGLFGEPQAPTTLETDPENPIVRRALALGEPRLSLCRRPWDAKSERLKRDITVEEIRKLKNFFQLSATDGGWRVAIIDAADELNTSAANALLKVLEEPPAKTVILLICHQPARLLPTIRSRCRGLRCQTLCVAHQIEALANAGFEPGTQAGPLAVLSDGSVGEALRLLNTNGVVLYERLVALAATAPGLNRNGGLDLANQCSKRDAAPLFDMTVHMIALLLSRLARYGVLQPAVWTEAAQGEAQMLAKLAPNADAGRKWAAFSQTISARVTHARAVNLDPSSVILDMLLKLDETARG